MTPTNVIFCTCLINICLAKNLFAFINSETDFRCKCKCIFIPTIFIDCVNIEINLYILIYKIIYKKYLLLKLHIWSIPMEFKLIGSSLSIQLLHKPRIPPNRTSINKYRYKVESKFKKTCCFPGYRSLKSVYYINFLHAKIPEKLTVHNVNTQCSVCSAEQSEQLSRVSSWAEWAADSAGDVMYRYFPFMFQVPVSLLSIYLFTCVWT